MTKWKPPASQVRQCHFCWGTKFGKGYYPPCRCDRPKPSDAPTHSIKLFKTPV